MHTIALHRIMTGPRAISQGTPHMASFLSSREGHRSVPSDRHHDDLLTLWPPRLLEGSKNGACADAISPPSEHTCGLQPVHRGQPAAMATNRDRPRPRWSVADRYDRLGH